MTNQNPHDDHQPDKPLDVDPDGTIDPIEFVEPAAENPAADETIRIEDDEFSTIDPAEPRRPANEVDETIRIDDQDDHSTIDPVQPQSHADKVEETVRVDEQDFSTIDSVAPQPPADDIDVTVQLNSTVNVEADPNDKTVVEFDQTVELDAAKPKTPTVSRGRGTVSFGSTVIDGDETAGASILASKQLDLTVNPRDLSEEDARAWDSAVGNRKDDPSVLPPAIDRTFSDKQFERLRDCDVAPLQSNPKETSDYRLVRKLGQGGMGDVFVARQGSLDRLLALKLIKPLSGKKRAQLQKTGKLESVEEERRQQFLSEAIVTGDLEHPNIVPIHDVAVTNNNEIFYAMKRVVGTPWSEVISEKSRDENLEILLKVADAIGFAHTRGVVHRDIKPENIMLGEFGVVMVMDWGLALPTPQYEKLESIYATSGLGGTPAFMAPEMATGPLDVIGPASDIYLLGATLFMIVTGAAPHHAKNITECLQAVRSNAIRDVPEAERGELIDIAMKAMASKPEDRYPDVTSFQKAIRDYRSHAASIALTASADADLESGKANQSYNDFARAKFRYDEALKSWSKNARALVGLEETRLAHAQAALDKGEHELGLSLLDESVAEHQPLIRQLREGIQKRAAEVTRLARLKKVAAAMAAFILIGSVVATGLIEMKRREVDDQRLAAVQAKELETAAKIQAENARAKAEIETAKATKAQRDESIARQEEEKAREAAEEARDAAKEAQNKESIARLDAERARDKEKAAKALEVAAREQAESARDDAKKAEAKAVASEARAKYEEYVSKIGLAKARLERNEADGAREILTDLRENSPESTKTWEWQWLWRQVQQSKSAAKVDDSVTDLAVSSNGKLAAVTLRDGTARLVQMNSQGQLAEQTESIELGDVFASCIAISKQGMLAVGTKTGSIHFPTTQQQIKAHDGPVTDLKYTSDGLLVSCSTDKTVRIWDQSGTELTSQTACWHISPVHQVTVQGTGQALQIAAVIADDASGMIALWKARRQGKTVSVQQVGEFTGHDSPVSSVTIARDGSLAASGDRSGNVLLWNPADVGRTNYTKSVRQAVQQLGKSTQKPKTSRIRFARLVDKTPADERRLVSTAPSIEAAAIAHDDIVKTIRFSQDGKALLSCSDDYTLKLWDVSSRRLSKTMKGHGGWVVAGEFLPGQSETILSASNDSSLKTWHPDDYVGAYLVQDVSDNGSKPNRQTEAHDKDIWSASFSPTGDRVITASRDHTARIMTIDQDTFEFKDIVRLQDELLDEGTSFVAMSMQVDVPNQRLYIGSADSTIRIWDLRLGTEISRAPGTGLNTSFAISRDGRLMLSGSDSTAIKAILWKLDPAGQRPPQILKRFKGHDQEVTAFAISPDSRYLFTGDRHGFGILWDAKTGERVGKPIQNVRGFRINAVQFSHDGQELILAADDEQLTRVSLQSRETISQLSHGGFVTQFSLSADGQHALTLSEFSTEKTYRSTATLWNLQTSKARVLDRVNRKQTSARNRSKVASAHFDQQGRIAVVSRAAIDKKPGTLKVWKVGDVALNLTEQLVGTNPMPSTTTPEPAQTLEVPEVLGTAEIALPIDERTLLTMNKNAAFKWDLASTRLIKSYRAHAELTEASFTWNGEFVATASRSVKIWDAKTGQALAKLETPHIGPVRSVQFAPRAIGGQKFVLATGGDDGVARCWSWNPETRKFKQLGQYAITGQEQTIRRVRFSPLNGDNRLLVVGDEGTARVWHLGDTKKPVAILDQQDAGNFLCGDFSDDGECISVGSDDHKVRVWQSLRDKPFVMKGHADAINDLHMRGNTEDLRIMTASADDTARIWDPRTSPRPAGIKHPGGRELLSLRRHQGDVTAVDTTSDGRLTLTAGRDGAVILWPAEAPNLFESIDGDR